MSRFYRKNNEYGKKVLALHRSKIGEISVKDLKIGTWRNLKQHEVDGLLKKC